MSKQSERKQRKIVERIRRRIRIGTAFAGVIQTQPVLITKAVSSYIKNDTGNRTDVR